MKVWDKLWRREKGRRETVVCANLKQTSSKRGMTMLQKCHLYKKDICMSLSVSHVFTND